MGPGPLQFLIMDTNHTASIALMVLALLIVGLLTLCTSCTSARGVLLERGDPAPFTGYLIEAPAEIAIPPAK